MKRLTVSFVALCAVSMLSGCVTALVAGSELAPALLSKIGGKGGSDASSATYVLQVPTTQDVFIRNVKASASDLGYSVESVSDAMTSSSPTVVMLSKVNNGMFSSSYSSLMVTLQPKDHRTIVISSRVNKKNGGDAAIAAFEKDLKKNYPAMVSQAD